MPEVSVVKEPRRRGQARLAVQIWHIPPMLSRLQLIQPVLMKPFHRDGYVYEAAVDPDGALDAARVARAPGALVTINVQLSPASDDEMIEEMPEPTG